LGEGAVVNWRTPELQEFADLLGVTDGALEHVGNASSIDEARARLEQLKHKVHRSYRRLALKLHPDRGGNEAKFQRLGTALTALRQYLDAVDLKPRTAARVRFRWMEVEGDADTVVRHFTNWWERVA
jgi:hypothetical protein